MPSTTPTLREVPDEWLAVHMRKDEPPQDNDLPSDSHLQEDISSQSEHEPDETTEHLTPGQTNAGQQVAGLASATNYGEDENPDSRQESNKPI
jgi:hypothetical protein